jgi:hypothetical protein
MAGGETHGVAHTGAAREHRPGRAAKGGGGEPPVCGGGDAMNLSLIQGLIDALPQAGRTACLDRRETGCCVAVGYASASSNERSDSIVTR